MPRVFAKRTFEFRRYVERDGLQVVAERALTRPFDFVDLPDWVVTDPLFGWGRRDGDIEVMASAADERAAELTAATAPAQGNRVRRERPGATSV